MTKWEDIDESSDFIQKDKVIAQKYFMQFFTSVIFNRASNRYIQNPLTVEGHKITFRIYVVVTSWNPLRVYVYKKGLTSLSAQKYRHSIDSFCEKFIHLTNLDINRQLEEEFVKNFSPNCKHEGLRVDMVDYFRMLKEEENVDIGLMWEKVKDAISVSLLSAEPTISPLVRKHINHS